MMTHIPASSTEIKLALFKCDACGCVENTAACYFNMDFYTTGKALCSECDPQIGKWHGLFAKEPWPSDGRYVDVRSPHWPHGEKKP